MGCYPLVGDGIVGWICGDLGEIDYCRESECGRFADMLCDYPVGEGKTCDRLLCKRHAVEVAPNIHYCPGHKAEWDKFVEAAGVRRVLENVVPFAKK